MKEVSICDPNYHKIRRSFALIFSKNYECFEKLYQTLKRVFHQISKHFEVGKKNSGAPRFFNPLLSVWISDETLFLVFDILLDCCNVSYVCQRNTEKCSDRKHHQHEADLLSKGRL